MICRRSRRRWPSWDTNQACDWRKAAERDYLKSGYEYTFDGARGRNLLEIKWQILPRFYSIGFDVNEFFERASAVTIEGQRLRTLCDQDLHARALCPRRQTCVEADFLAVRHCSTGPVACDSIGRR